MRIKVQLNLHQLWESELLTSKNIKTHPEKDRGLEVLSQGKKSKPYILNQNDFHGIIVKILRSFEYEAEH